MNVASLSAILKSAFRFPVWNADADALIAPDGSEVALGGGSWDGVLAKGTITTDQKVMDLSVTWNNAAVTFTGLKLNVTDTASNAASLLMDLQVGGTSKFSVTKGGDVKIPSGARITGGLTNPAEITFTQGNNGGVGFELYNDSAPSFAFWSEPGTGKSQMRSRNSGEVVWTDNSTAVSGAADVRLARDAAGSLAQRNSTNAQTFNIYNTYTDASNYERGFMKWNSNVLEIGTEAAGTGTARVWKIVGGASGSPTAYTAGSTVWVGNSTFLAGFATTGIIVGGNSDVGFKRTAAGIVGITNTTTGGGVLGMQEVTAPSAPSTDGVYIYAEDNGSGKTRLMALFATGAAQQIAIQP